MTISTIDESQRKAARVAEKSRAASQAGARTLGERSFDIVG